tara:strand:+ start:2944 stop:3198 length:255 start_codon:yes stop_codon:yes gene_type:complete
MPKYYIKDGYEKIIIDAPEPEEAVVKAVLFFFNTFVINGFYLVSERGFDKHTDCSDDEDDLVFDSNYILDLITEKKRKEDQDGA